MIRKLFTITLLAGLVARVNPLSAQTQTDSIKSTKSELRPSNRMYFEIFGNGLLYSVNFERQFPRSYGSIGYRIGVGYTEADGLELLAIPVGLNMIFGKSNRCFETGLGFSYIRRVEAENSYYTYYNSSTGYTEYSTRESEVHSNQLSVVLNFGYRSEPKSMPGVSFRAGFSPTYYDGDFVPYLPYLSIGYKFN